MFIKNLSFSFIVLATFVGYSFASVCGNGIIESPDGEVITRLENPHELCDDGNLFDGDGCSSLCGVEYSSTECSDLNVFDYDNDFSVSTQDILLLINRLEVFGGTTCTESEYSLEGGCCPEGKICTSSCNPRFSALDIVGIVNQVRSGEVSDYGGCFEGVQQCPTQPTTCSDYDAFDYNDDGQVDNKDVVYIRNAGRVRDPLMTECDGTVLDSQRGGEFCCPEGKICDLYCTRSGFSKGVIHQNIDAYTLQNAIRQKRLPTSCQDDMPVCEETNYPEVEFVRMPGTGRVIAIRYKNTDGSTANMTRTLEASKFEISSFMK